MRDRAPLFTCCVSVERNRISPTMLNCRPIMVRNGSELVLNHSEKRRLCYEVRACRRYAPLAAISFQQASQYGVPKSGTGHHFVNVSRDGRSKHPLHSADGPSKTFDRCHQKGHAYQILRKGTVFPPLGPMSAYTRHVCGAVSRGRFHPPWYSCWCLTLRLEKANIELSRML